jgi:hypothetical protein
MEIKRNDFEITHPDKKLYFASIVLSAINIEKSKQFFGFGKTKKEAIDGLIKYLIKHLQKLL